MVKPNHSSHPKHQIQKSSGRAINYLKTANTMVTCKLMRSVTSNEFELTFIPVYSFPKTDENGDIVAFQRREYDHTVRLHHTLY